LVLRVVDGGFFVTSRFFVAVSFVGIGLRAVHLAASHVVGSDVGVLVLLSGYVDLLGHLIWVFSVHLKLIGILIEGRVNLN
jgi:hypothetical protein